MNRAPFPIRVAPASEPVSNSAQSTDTPVPTRRLAPRSLTAAPVRRTVGRIALSCFAVIGAGSLATFVRSASADDGTCTALIAKARVALEEAQKNRDMAKAREAVVYLDRAAKLCPEDVEIPFLESLSHIVLSDMDGTLAAKRRMESLLTSRALELNRPAADAVNDPHVLYVQALVHSRFGSRPGDAAATLRLLRNRDPNFRPADVLRLLFVSLLQFSAQLVQNDDLEFALRQASMARSLVRGDEMRWDEASHRVAQILSASHRWAEAQPELERLAKSRPLDAQVRFDLAGVYAEQLHFDQAIDAWRETLRLLALPDVDRRVRDLLSDSKMRLGNCLVQSGKLDEGKTTLKEYIAANPNDGRGWYFLGKACVDFAPEDYDRALTCFERAHQLDAACEKTLRELYKLYSTVRPDEAKAKAIKTEIDAGMKAREAEFARRKRTRLDGSNGCY